MVQVLGIFIITYLLVGVAFAALTVWLVKSDWFLGILLEEATDRGDEEILKSYEKLSDALQGDRKYSNITTLVLVTPLAYSLVIVIAVIGFIKSKLYKLFKK